MTADHGADPFPLPVLARLQELTGADDAAAYVESGVDKHGRPMRYELVTRPQPGWLWPALDRVGKQDPIHAIYCRDATAPVAISDRMPVREFQQLELLRPHLAHARARHDDVLGVSADGQLNPREIEIMRRVACGASNAEVARRLWLSQHTVRKHLENIYAKLGVQSRTAALNALGNMRDERRHPTFQ